MIKLASLIRATVIVVLMFCFAIFARAEEPSVHPVTSLLAKRADDDDDKKGRAG